MIVPDSTLISCEEEDRQSLHLELALTVAKLPTGWEAALHTASYQDPVQIVD